VNSVKFAKEPYGSMAVESMSPWSAWNLEPQPKIEPIFCGRHQLWHNSLILTSFGWKALLQKVIILEAELLLWAPGTISFCTACHVKVASHVVYPCVRQPPEVEHSCLCSDGIWWWAQQRSAEVWELKSFARQTNFVWVKGMFIWTW